MTAVTFKDLDLVRLKKDLPAEGLAAGAHGTIVYVFGDADAYQVEFCDADGETIAEPALKAGDLELVPEAERWAAARSA